MKNNDDLEKIIWKNATGNEREKVMESIKRKRKSNIFQMVYAMPIILLFLFMVSLLATQIRKNAVQEVPIVVGLFMIMGAVIFSWLFILIRYQVEMNNAIHRGNFYITEADLCNVERRGYDVNSRKYYGDLVFQGINVSQRIRLTYSQYEDAKEKMKSSGEGSRFHVIAFKLGERNSKGNLYFIGANNRPSYGQIKDLMKRAQEI